MDIPRWILGVDSYYRLLLVRSLALPSLHRAREGAGCGPKRRRSFGNVLPVERKSVRTVMLFSTYSALP